MAKPNRGLVENPFWCFSTFNLARSAACVQASLHASIVLEMPLLRLSRDRGFADMLRGYKVFLNDEIVGSIRAGRDMEFEIASGKHTLEVRIDWCTTGPLSFQAGDSPEEFRVFSKLRGWRFLFSGGAALDPDGWIGLEHLKHSEPEEPKRKSRSTRPPDPLRLESSP